MATKNKKKIVRKGKTSKVKKPKARPRIAQRSRKDFFTVGIGASAGGLEAFKEFLTYLPTSTKMAFVFIQHLSPKHASHLPDILSRMTTIPVHEATNGMEVQPDNIYVIPPNVTMFMKNGALNLIKRSSKDKPHLPIDRFLESLASDQGHRGIAVVLSGTGSDGAEGARIIKSSGGISFAQTLDTARFDSMPAKAIIIDDIDFILPPKAIALELANISNMYLAEVGDKKIIHESPAENDKEFLKIMLMLKQTTGTDFTQYKPTTIRRRITRRMLLHKLNSMKNYFKFLQENPAERIHLGEDVLINVTTFFRESESYEYLKHELLPAILKNKSAEAPLRIWVAGCSTGEEAYSIAICVMEVLGPNVHPQNVQIFATDLSDKCIERARLGKYLESISEHVSAERLAKFFTRNENGYRIAKSVRDICVFARHDLSRDPAYSKLDLISCKNLLIYLGQELQSRIMESFHYSLNPNAYLMLGGSESVGSASDLFTLTESKFKVYVKKSVAPRLQTMHTRREYIPLDQTPAKLKKEFMAPSAYEVQLEADRAILARYSPPSVVVNSKLEILQFRGTTDQFLVHKHGEANLNLLRMAREGLSNELKKSITKAREKDISVREENIQMMGVGLMNFEIIPLKFLPGDRCYLIAFEMVQRNVSDELVSKNSSKNKKVIQNDYEAVLVNQLKQELNSVKDNLQAVIQDFEKANQDLQSANEEIVSSNEELQSTNEELETSKEELQSTNEELSTVNDELQERNEELFSLNNDLLNVLNSVQIPILIVGNDLSIRRYTPSASKIFNFIPTDIGRPFSHITSAVLDMDELERMIKNVLDNAIVQEKELQLKDGSWIHLRIRPYKTEEQKIEGAVLTMHEFDELKKFVDLTKIITNSVLQPLLILDGEFKILNANDAFYKTFKIKPATIEQQLITEIGNGSWDKTKMKKLITKAASRNESITETLEIGKKKLGVMVKQITKNKLIPTQYLMIFTDGQEQQ